MENVQIKKSKIPKFNLINLMFFIDLRFLVFLPVTNGLKNHFNTIVYDAKNHSNIDDSRNPDFVFVLL